MNKLGESHGGQYDALLVFGPGSTVQVENPRLRTDGVKMGGQLGRACVFREERQWGRATQTFWVRATTSMASLAPALQRATVLFEEPVSLAIWR